MAGATPLRSSPPAARILIVEDQALIALLLQNTLQQAGFWVMDAVSSNCEALALLARERPDTMQLDGTLIDGRATPVAAALRSIGVSFAVLTGQAADDLTEVAFAAAPWIAKPFSEATVVRIVQQQIAQGPAMLGHPGGTAPDGAAP